MEESKDYFAKGYDTLQESKMKRIMNNLTTDKNSLELSYLLGFEKASKLKDVENQESINIINKVDSNEIINILDDIAPLIQLLKNNKDDIYIKQKIINDIIILNNYFAKVLNKPICQSEGI